MKRMGILCAYPASTAICLSMDQASSSAVQLGGRAIDRHNPIIRDAKRFSRTVPSNPCTSQPPPINPLPYNQLRKNEKKSLTKSNNAVSAKSNDHKKKSSTKSSLKPIDSDVKDADKGCKSFAKAVDFVTPPGSSSYLLGGDSAFFDGISDSDPVWALVPAETRKIQVIIQDQSVVSKPSSSRSEKPRTDQVVVLRVSLHCKGCEGKVRKHLSRMEGVSSFSIDFAAKKLTIIGDKTPLGVLASVSKVKRARFWSSAMSASSNLATKK